MTQIMYVCDLCAEGNPEGCGHYDRDDLRVWPGDDDHTETTICEYCYGDWKAWHGNLDARPEWAAMPMPEQMIPASMLDATAAMALDAEVSRLQEDLGWQKHAANLHAERHEAAEQKYLRLQAELQAIADAKPEAWEDPGAFRDWAQSRARHAVAFGTE